MARKLRYRQMDFIIEYMKDRNGQRAAERAGYKHPDIAAARLLTVPAVIEEIDRRTNKIVQKVEINVEDVVRELLRMAMSDINDAYTDDNCLKNIKDIPLDLRRAISSVEVFEEFQGAGAEREFIGYTKKIKFWDKSKAVEMLGKYLKMFVERMELTGKDGQPIQAVVVHQTEEEIIREIENLEKQLQLEPCTRN